MLRGRQNISEWIRRVIAVHQIRRVAICLIIRTGVSLVAREALHVLGAVHCDTSGEQARVRLRCDHELGLVADH